MTVPEKPQLFCGGVWERAMFGQQVPWVGPFALIDYLGAVLNEGHRWPAESNGIYVVSTASWRGRPTIACRPLYVGLSSVLITRIGSLVADMLGLFAHESGHHSGGRTIYFYCKKTGIPPLKLYLGWKESVPWEHCCEFYEYWRLNRPPCNSRAKGKEPWCQSHLPPTTILSIRKVYQEKLETASGMDVADILWEYLAEEQAAWEEDLSWQPSVCERFLNAAATARTTFEGLRIMKTLRDTGFQ